jgi:hypothetical protein
MSRASPSSKHNFPRDPILADVVALLGDLPVKDIAGQSNHLVSAQTLRNWKAGKVRRPCNYTIEATLKVLGYHRPLTKIRVKKS